MTTGHEGGVAGLTFAGLMTMQLMGISIETMAVATSFCLLGTFGRLGFEISAAAAANGARWGAIAFLFGGSLIAAPTLSIVTLLVLKLVGVQNDSATIFGLIFVGFFGAPILPWLFNTGSNLFKKLGLTLPQVGAGPEAPEKRP